MASMALVLRASRPRWPSFHVRCASFQQKLILRSPSGRVPVAKRNRRQLGMVMDMGDEKPERLRCRDEEQGKLMEEIYEKGRYNWDAMFEAYGNINNPDPALATAVLSLAEKCGKVKEAFDVYAELRRRKELTARMCSHMIRIAGRVHSAMAHAMLSDMRVCQLDPTPPNYLALLEIYKKEKDAEGARILWQEMLKDSVPQTEVLLCSVMSVVAKSGDVAGTEAFLLTDCPIITAHFNCCLDACHVAGDADSALRILQEMQAANCKPDVISYNSALGALDRAGKGKEERDRLLEDMQRNEVKPNELFVERHIACVLRIPQQGVELRPEMLQTLPQEAMEEAKGILRQMDHLKLRNTKLLRRVKELLDLDPTAAPDPAASAEASPASSVDWVKVTGKDEVGSSIEYFWDRRSGLTQWHHPGCQVNETVAAA